MCHRLLDKSESSRAQWQQWKRLDATESAFKLQLAAEKANTPLDEVLFGNSDYTWDVILRGVPLIKFTAPQYAGLVAKEPEHLNDRERVISQLLAEGPEGLELDGPVWSPVADASSGNAGRAEHWKIQGNDMLKAGDLSGALSCYTRGLDVAGPGVLRGLLYSNRAHVLLQLSREDEAIEDCRAALQDDEGNAKAYWRGGTAALRMERYDEARSFCEMGLAMTGKNDKLTELLAQCTAATAE